MEKKGNKKMEEKKQNVVSEEKREYTKEELIKLVNSLSNDVNILLQQRDGLQKDCEELLRKLSYRRVDYLFKIIECPDFRSNTDLLSKCYQEIEETLYPKKELNNTENKEQ